MITNYFKLCKCGQLLKWTFELYCQDCQDNYEWEYEAGDRVHCLIPLSTSIPKHTSGTVEQHLFRDQFQTLLPQYLVYFATEPTYPNLRMWVSEHEIAAGRPPK